MSYILEALKKSQQERELGQVPTLDASGLFVEDKEPLPQSRWAALAVALALLAVLIALYAALRTGPAPVTAPPPSVEPAAPQTSATQGALPATAAPGRSPAVAGQAGADAPAGLAQPGRPLVEAPPPKRIPRPVPEAPVERRPERPAAPTRVIDDLPVAAELDPIEEEALLRQLQEEQSALSGQTQAVLDAPPQPGPIPPDLLQDIEAFKQRVRQEQGAPSRTKAKSSRINGDPTRLRLTPAQQEMVPGFLMTVHVYDADDAKRFVVINTQKYREGEDTREGLHVEQILKDGAVLSHLGNPFYVPR